MASSKKATTREVTVLVRYEMKKDCLEKGLHKGDVVLYIENDKRVRYYTTLRRNKAHSCTCASRKRCYHIDQMVIAQNERYAASKAEQRQDTLPAQPAIALVAEDPDTYWDKDQCTRCFVTTRQPVDPVAQAAKLDKQRRDYEIEVLEASLNGNRGFELLKVS